MPDLREKIFENLRQKNVFSDLPEANPTILTAKINKILEESCSAIPRTKKTSCLGVLLRKYSVINNKLLYFLLLSNIKFY